MRGVRLPVLWVIVGSLLCGGCQSFSRNGLPGQYEPEVEEGRLETPTSDSNYCHRKQPATFQPTGMRVWRS